MRIRSRNIYRRHCRVEISLRQQSFVGRFHSRRRDNFRVGVYAIRRIVLAFAEKVVLVVDLIVITVDSGSRQNDYCQLDSRPPN